MLFHFTFTPLSPISRRKHIVYRASHSSIHSRTMENSQDQGQGIQLTRHRHTPSNVVSSMACDLNGLSVFVWKSFSQLQSSRLHLGWPESGTSFSIFLRMGDNALSPNATLGLSLSCRNARILLCGSLYY